MFKKTNAWLWIPTVYFASGLPYHAITSISDIMYKDMGIGIAETALYTSILAIPWTIKPLWSPFVEMINTRRKWTLVSQFLLAICFAAIAIAIPAKHFLALTLTIFMTGAFVSSTHDIAADGFYMLALPQEKQSFFSGIRNTFYRIATVFSSGILVLLADIIEKRTGNTGIAWSATFATTAIIMLALFLYHKKSVPKPSSDISRKPKNINEIFNNFGDIIKSYFNKKGIWTAMLFLLLFRFPEAQLGKIGKLFLMDSFPVTAKYEEAKAFSDSLALVKFDGKYGYVDMDGKEVIAMEFDKATSFSDGVARVSKQGREFFINKEGKDTIINHIPDFEKAVSTTIIEEHTFPISVTEEYDSVGKLVNGYAIVKKGEKYGFIDKNGKKAIPVRFDHVEEPQEGMMLIRNDNLYGFVSPKGGLCLDKGDIGFANGIIGVIGLILGGILGGICISRKGLKYWLWPMVFAISLPDAVYVYLSMVLPESITAISTCIFIEQLGYGFGFTAYTLYMIYFAQGKYPTAHFAISTAFMSLGMMLPGMVSGYIQKWIGYEYFFIWVMLCTLITFAVSAMIKIDPKFGKKQE